MSFNLKGMFGKKKKAPVLIDVDDGVIVTTKSGDNEQVRKALVWAKAHALPLGLGVVALAALASGIVFSADLAAGNGEKAQALAAPMDSLRKLERTSVTIAIPGNDPVQWSGVVNARLVAEVQRCMSTGDQAREDVMALAVAHNGRQRTPAISLRLQAKDPKVQQAHQDMQDAMRVAYDALLAACKATLPPSEEDVKVELRKTKHRFMQMNQVGQAAAAAGTAGQPVQASGSAGSQAKAKGAMDPKLEEQLRSELKARRLGEYSKAAKEGGVYCSAEALGFDPAPAAKGTDKDLLPELWRRQMKFWIAEDVVQAVITLNQGKPIPDAPVKRIVGISFASLTPGGESSSDGSFAPPPDAPPTDAPPPAEGEGAVEAATGAPIDPQSPVSLTAFDKGLAGWATNQLFDVHSIVLRCVVETSRIPAFINALSRQNFMVVTNASIRPVDPFAAAQEGYYYGAAEPVSLLALSIDSAWLRQWTGPHMPDAVRKKLGTSGSVQSAGGTEGGAADGGAEGAPVDPAGGGAG